MDSESFYKLTKEGFAKLPRESRGSGRYLNEMDEIRGSDLTEEELIAGLKWRLEFMEERIAKDNRLDNEAAFEALYHVMTTICSVCVLLDISSEWIPSPSGSPECRPKLGWEYVKA